MSTRKEIRELKMLGVATVVVWVTTTFACIVFWYRGGGEMGLPRPTEKPVSPAMYEASLQTIRVLVFTVIPALAAWYLLLGLLLLRLSERIKQYENTTA